MAKKNRQLALWSFPRALNSKKFKAGDDRDLRLYTLPALALMTGKWTGQLANYEASGVLPVTPYRVMNTRKLTRYYTFDQMRVVRETLHDVQVRGNREEVNRRITLGWVIAGVPMEPGLEFGAALLLSAGSDDCEPVEKEFLLRAIEAEKEKKNGETEGGSVDGLWRYLKSESSETPHAKKSKRSLAQRFNEICSGQSETFGEGFAGDAGRGDSGFDREPLYSESGSRLWRSPRSRGVRGDSVDK